MEKSVESSVDNLKVIYGALLTFSYIFLLLLSIPVYIFRCFVTLFAKLSNPDLDDILSGFTSMLVNDYFTEAPCSRSNIIVTMAFEGQLTLQELRSTVMRNWIQAKNLDSGEPTFKKFQQYPERWLGFTFWKNATDTFSLENHVMLASDNEEPVEQEELNDIVEKLLNSHFPRKQSPWEIHLIEKYGGSPSRRQKSVVILKTHHALADGFSLLTAFFELCECPMDSVKQASPNLPKRTLRQKLLFLVSIPIIGFWEASYILSHQFKHSPWKIPEERKEWYQVCAKSEPISIQTVKEIKNHFGASFTSVILSAFSAAINKHLGSPKTEEFKKVNNNSMLCLSILPAIGQEKKRMLTNHLTAALFNIPTKSFSNPVERLKTVNLILETTKNSLMPILTPYLFNLVGAHFHRVCEAIMTNKIISTGLTNFPGVLMKLKLNGRDLLAADFVVGCQQGDGGLGIMTLGYNQHMRVGVVAEKALMTRKDAGQFLKHLTKEIQLLHSLIDERNTQAE